MRIRRFVQQYAIDQISSCESIETRPVRRSTGSHFAACDRRFVRARSAIHAGLRSGLFGFILSLLIHVFVGVGIIERDAVLQFGRAAYRGSTNRRDVSTTTNLRKSNSKTAIV